MTNQILKFTSTMRTSIAAALLTALASGVAQAHPGHGLHEASASHVLTSPYHLAVLALSGATIWFSARWVERRLPRRLLQSIGIAAVMTAALFPFIRA